jgi:hypothetical protein
MPRYPEIIRREERFNRRPREAFRMDPGMGYRHQGMAREVADDVALAELGAAGIEAVASAFNWTQQQKNNMNRYRNSSTVVQSSMQNDPKGLKIKLDNLKPHQAYKLFTYGIEWSTIPNQNYRNCVIASKFGNITQANPIFMGFIDPTISVIKGSGWYGNTAITNKQVYLMGDGNFYLNMEFTYSQKCKLKLNNGIPIRQPLNFNGSIPSQQPMQSMLQQQMPPNPQQQQMPPNPQQQQNIYHRIFGEPKQQQMQPQQLILEQYYIFEIYNGGNASGAGKKVKKPTTKKPAVKKPTTKKTPVKKPTTKKPAVKKPTTKKPTTKKPVKKTTTKKPTVKKPTKKTPVKKPTTKKPVKKTTTKKPTVKKTNVKKPTKK